MNGAKAPETPSPVLQEKTVTPQTLPTVIGADEGYTGLSQVTVNPDTNLKAENIRSGKTIFGVDGTFEGTVTQGDKFAKLIDRSIATMTAEDFGNATSVGAYAFSQCKNLTSVEFPSTMKVIKQRAFEDCANVTFNGTEHLTEIGSYAFSYCFSITSLDLSSATKLEGSFAYNCSGLTSVVLSEELTSIPSTAFSSCRALSSITIPASVTEINMYAFQYCASLTSVIMEPTTPPTADVGFLQGTSENLVITVPKGSLGAYQTATNWSAYADKMVEATE